MALLRAAAAAAASRRSNNNNMIMGGVSQRRRLLTATTSTTALRQNTNKMHPYCQGGGGAVIMNNGMNGGSWLQRQGGAAAVRFWQLHVRQHQSPQQQYIAGFSSWQQSNNHHHFNSNNNSQIKHHTLHYQQAAAAAATTTFIERQQQHFLPVLPSFLDLLSEQFWWFSKADNSNNKKNKIPGGFQDFFPPNNRHGKSLEEQQQQLQQEQQQQDEATSSSNSDQRLSSKNNGDSSSNKQNKHSSSSSGGGKHNNNNNNNDANNNNLTGMLTLVLALIVALRSSMERQRQEMGQEITFTDFRRDFLYTGRVDKIIVVNNSMARIIFKKHNNQHQYHQHQNHHEVESLTLDHGVSGSSTTLPANDNDQQNQNQQHYFFYIGSVESLEEKLTRAQQDAHPQDWVQVQYVTRTNLATEVFKHLPLFAFMAAMYFGMRHVTGGAGIMGGSGGSGSSGRGGSGSGGIFSIGRSPAKKIKKEDVNVSFADVAGCTQAKMEIMEFVDFLKDSSRFTKLGAKIPKGALLCGPPGTGKTLLAKAVAGEAGVPFYSISGSEFLEMFVGVGPSRVRDLFKEARQNTPCIIFIDEIDAVGRQRGRGGFSGGGNDERENTLNQLLVEMDGFSPTSGIVVLAGTNRVDILDQALLRPGRFDRQIQVDRPDLQGRKEIFQVHLRGIKLDQAEAERANGGDDKAGSDSDKKAPIPIEDHYAGRLAGLTPGFAGADIANICNEAAIVAARRKADSVAMEDFDKATDRIIGGLESTKILSKEERSIVAHHEAGHAVAGWFLEHADPLLKVTIIPRASGALGFAQYLPKEVFLRSRDQIMDIVCMALAGRAAEQVFFGQVTTGAADDLRRVTQLVYSMIKDYGMHSSVGQLAYPSQNDNNFGDKPYSDSTAEAMDDEARSIVNDAYERTVALIREHQQDVDKVACVLLEKETITHDDLVDLIGERPFQRDAAYDEYVRRRQPTPPNAEKDELQPDSPPEEDNNDTVVPGNLTPGLA